jgi:hypothetical protein
VRGPKLEENMNKNEKRSLRRGIAAQVVASLAPSADSTIAIAIEALGIANMLVNRLELAEENEDRIISSPIAKAVGTEGALNAGGGEVNPWPVTTQSGLDLAHAAAERKAAAVDKAAGAEAVEPH